MGVISVACNNKAQYPKKGNLFRPYINYPEYLFKDDLSPEPNDVYDLVRQALKMLSLDINNYGSENWNPLGDGYIQPGDHVVIKPNLVSDKNLSNSGTDCLYTHPSVVAAIIDYVCIALKGNGRIIVADAPIQTCDFDHLIEDSGYSSMVKYYKEKGVEIELYDLRGLISENIANVIRATIKPQVLDGICVRLNEYSLHSTLPQELIDAERITSYDPAELKKYHDGQKHEYLIAKDVLLSDCIINICKPKTHRKAGVTISLKNLIGTVVRKECLPHHRVGGIARGIGDEYYGYSFLKELKWRLVDTENKFATKKMVIFAKLFVLFVKIVHELDKILLRNSSKYFEGSWWGNDTIWRTILDINRIVRYADKHGVMCGNSQRKIFNIGDMIIMGEGEGPLMPTPKHSGIIAMGDNGVCFDEAIATLMGMDINKIPFIRNARNLRTEWPLINNNEKTEIISNNVQWSKKNVLDFDILDTFHLTPSDGWKGNIELPS